MIDYRHLRDPIGFKARAFLDTYRGGMAATKNERDSFCYATEGWGKAARKLADPYQPIPDRWYGTNCTPRRWNTARSLKLTGYSLSLWLYLLSLDPDAMPWTMTKVEKEQVFGSFLAGVTKGLRKHRLIAAGESRGRCQEKIYQVFEEPVSYEKISYWRKRLAPTVIAPCGTQYTICGVPGQFARKHGLGPSYFRKLINGEIEKYKGWRLVER